MSLSPALVLLALRSGWPPGFSPPDGMLTDWMGGSGRRWGAPVTWFTGRAAGVAGRRLAVVPRHYNRSSTFGSEESAQAHITSSPLPLLLLTPSPASLTQQHTPLCLPSSSPAPHWGIVRREGGEAHNNSCCVMRATPLRWRHYDAHTNT